MIACMLTRTAIPENVLAAAAERLLRAEATKTPCAPVRDLIGADDLYAAYAVQQRVVDSHLAQGSVVVGRKIGLTSPAVQKQFGVDRPDFGRLFDHMAYIGGDTVPVGSILQPRVEAEIAFILARDLDTGNLDVDQVRGAVDYAVAAIEICGSRIASWDIGFGDTVADNASTGAYVLGPRRMKLSEFEPQDVEMSMSIDGSEVSSGNGTACLGSPLNAVVWLARQARDLGDPLRAGEVVLSGALGPMHPVTASGQVTANISTLGNVTVKFS